MFFVNPTASIIYSSFLLGSVYLNSVSLTQLNIILMKPKNGLENKNYILPIILNSVVFVTSGLFFCCMFVKRIDII